MAKSRLTLVLLSVLLILSFTLSPVQADVEIPDSGVINPDEVFDDPNQVYPKVYTYSSLPTFQFTQYESSKIYRIKVNYWDNTPYYTYRGTAVCSAGICSLKPTTPLTKIIGLTPGNAYRWSVEAKKSDGTWTGTTNWVGFARVVKGFNSTFDTERKKWVDIHGTWSLTTAGRLRNTGIVGEYTSVANKYYIVGDYTYEARIKLTSAATYGTGDFVHQFGGLVVKGGGIPDQLLTDEDYAWYNGIYIVLRNDQKARIFEYFGGAYQESLDQGWEAVSSIVPNGWNTIKVQIIRNVMTVYINGVEWRTFTDPVNYLPQRDGYVGLIHFRQKPEAEKMQVDWATLTIDPSFITGE